MALQIKKCCNKPSPGWPLEGFEVRRGQIGGYDLLVRMFRVVSLVRIVVKSFCE